MKWFTIYWLGGTVSCICGESIDQAFRDAGYGAGALKAVDWYDNGISTTHWYDKQQKAWVEYLEIKMEVSDFLLMNIEDLARIMNTHNTITVRFDNDDIVTLSRDWGNFYLNNQSCWVNYIHLTFGEYFKGTYNGDSDDEENSHYYMMSNGQYFAPDNLPHALDAFMKRVKSSPFNAWVNNYCEKLEDIHAKQKVSFIT